MVTTTARLGFGLGAAAYLHLIDLGDQRWFAFDRMGQVKLPFKSLKARVTYFDCESGRYNKASLSLHDGETAYDFAPSYLRDELCRSMAMIGTKTGDVIEISLGAAGEPLVKKVA